MMLELLLIIIVLAVIFGPGADWGYGPRGGLFGLLLLIVILWLFLGPHHPNWYY